MCVIAVVLALWWYTSNDQETTKYPLKRSKQSLHPLQVLARNAAWSAEMLAAVRTQSTEAVLSVLAHTSLPRSRYTSSCAALQIAEPAPFFLEVKGQGRVTPLALAAARNDLNAVSTTSSSGCDAAVACTRAVLQFKNSRTGIVALAAVERSRNIACNSCSACVTERFLRSFYYYCMHDCIAITSKLHAVNEPVTTLYCTILYSCGSCWRQELLLAVKLLHGQQLVAMSSL
jgi:hypothetical protein